MRRGEPVDLRVLSGGLGFRTLTVLLILLVSGGEPALPVRLGSGVLPLGLLKLCLAAESCCRYLLWPPNILPKPVGAGGSKRWQSGPGIGWASWPGLNGGCWTRFLSRVKAMGRR